jgi:hypothetical protein
LSPIISAPAKRSFVVRAESNPEAEEEADAEAEVVESVDETEAEVKSEVAKSPWKARVKLGDVMGVIHWKLSLSLSLNICLVLEKTQEKKRKWEFNLPFTFKNEKKKEKKRNCILNGTLTENSFHFLFLTEGFEEKCCFGCFMFEEEETGTPKMDCFEKREFWNILSNMSFCNSTTRKLFSENRTKMGPKISNKLMFMWGSRKTCTHIREKVQLEWDVYII